LLASLLVTAGIRRGRREERAASREERGEKREERGERRGERRERKGAATALERRLVGLPARSISREEERGEERGEERVGAEQQRSYAYQHVTKPLCSAN
jgi:hypothetical protein